MTDPVVLEQGVKAILGGFEAYHDKFRSVTTRARRRFEQRDWRGMQTDALERLDLYGGEVNQVVQQVGQIYGHDARDKKTWAQMKELYSSRISGREDVELAETFFNSITRRIFTTVGVDAAIEFVDSEFETHPSRQEENICRFYQHQGSTNCLLEMVFADYPFEAKFEDLTRDIDLAAKVIDRKLLELNTNGEPDFTFEILKPVFYRGKGAYIIGRIHTAKRVIPVLFSLRHPQNGIVLDAVLFDEDDLSIVFSYTRSYFHVEAWQPYRMVEFLKSIMPLKRTAELYISLGFNKHGKTELYRDLLHHLENSEDQFEAAAGEKGMVMLVFTLPSYDLVFKVIRDRFAEPKTTTRQDVMERYQLVFKHDRAGRLVDAQEFEHLQFEKRRFSDALLKELLQDAPGSVKVEGDYIAIRHLYTERRLVPLNLYIQQAANQSVRDAVVDYGYAIKNLAATNIFPGDILLKNFGVTRHGRVVFYDYDELCLITSCRFRSVPPASSDSDEFESDPWFYINPDDIFPAEFKTFLGLQGELREAFIEEHDDLFEVKFWREIQSRIKAGEVVDIIPYKQDRRLHAAS